MKTFEILLMKSDSLQGEPTNKILSINAHSEVEARDKAIIPDGFFSAGIREVIKVEGAQIFVVTE
ncbi:hypothetical protein [Gimesia aquarii]|uniref:Uncharacterized protein n=1 Tax=Gimesia aquarii TaxID=2527964 RepID=A0A517VR93_9PLAN|nr:hypothetical protein [Gimesia aquarii]QDT95523.1 hypothetical protein V144x_09680 [Gimesia aquarii]